jgi:hypothetical protein
MPPSNYKSPVKPRGQSVCDPLGGTSLALNTHAAPAHAVVECNFGQVNPPSSPSFQVLGNLPVELPDCEHNKPARFRAEVMTAVPNTAMEELHNCIVLTSTPTYQHTNIAARWCDTYIQAHQNTSLLWHLHTYQHTSTVLTVAMATTTLRWEQQARAHKADSCCQCDSKRSALSSHVTALAGPTVT